MANESPQAQITRRRSRNTFANALRTTRSTLLTGADAVWGESWVLEYPWVLEWAAELKLASL